MLTEKGVAALKPEPGKRIEKWDTGGVAGFGLRVGESGRKAWQLVYRFEGKPRRLTLGTYPRMALSVARAEARRVRELVERGIDPDQAKAEDQRRQADTLAAVVDEFIERYAKPRNKTWKRQHKDLQIAFVSIWGDRPISSITKREIIRAVDAIADRTSPQRANKYLSWLKTMFRWAVDRDLIEISPAQTIKMPGKQNVRDRVLSADEIRLFWNNASAAGFPHQNILRLLMLTGARLNEIAAARWSDIDLERGILTVPPERSKNKQALEIVLSSKAVELLRAQPRMLHNPLAFPAMRSGGVPDNWTKATDRVRDAMGISDWRIHDVRRTVATNLAEMQISPWVIEEILGHKTGGSLSRIHRVYNKFNFEPQKRQALELWAERVEQLAGGAAPRHAAR